MGLFSEKWLYAGGMEAVKGVTNVTLMAAAYHGIQPAVEALGAIGFPNLNDPYTRQVVGDVGRLILTSGYAVNALGNSKIALERCFMSIRGILPPGYYIVDGWRVFLHYPKVASAIKKEEKWKEKIDGFSDVNRFGLNSIRDQLIKPIAVIEFLASKKVFDLYRNRLEQDRSIFHRLLNESLARPNNVSYLTSGASLLETENPHLQKLITEALKIGEEYTSKLDSDEFLYTDEKIRGVHVSGYSALDFKAKIELALRAHKTYHKLLLEFIKYGKK